MSRNPGFGGALDLHREGVTRTGSAWSFLGDRSEHHRHAETHQIESRYRSSVKSRDGVEHRVDVSERKARIMAACSKLIWVLAAWKAIEAVANGVRKVVAEWRRGRDSNPRYA